MGKIGTPLFFAFNAVCVGVCVGAFLRGVHAADWVVSNFPGALTIIVFFVLVTLTDDARGR